MLLARLALLALILLAAPAAAEFYLWASNSVRVAWTEPPYIATLPPDTYAPLQYRVERQVNGAGPWEVLATGEALSFVATLIPCADQSFRIGAIYDGSIIIYSDVVDSIATCGNPDLTGDGVVKAGDVSWCARAFGRHLAGGEWVP